MRTRKILRAFLETCRRVQLLHACVVKFKVSGTVVPLCRPNIGKVVVTMQMPLAAIALSYNNFYENC